MSFLVQHGYGKSSYIESCIADDTAEGVILSPRDETPTALRQYAKTCAAAKYTVLLDPQFYAFTIPDARLRHLSEYPYQQGLLTRRDFVRASSTRKRATEVLAYQAKLPLTWNISAGLMLESFEDSFSQIQLSLYEESIAASQSGERGLLLSLAAYETAFANLDAVDEFLDLITSWDFAGIYLTVQPRSTMYPSSYSPDTFANLLYLIYVLAEVNKRVVVVGYTDFSSVMHCCAGASFCASGWYNSLRQFSIGRFIPSKGGSRARPRVSSPRLLTSILQVPELSSINDLKLLRRTLGDSVIDKELRENPETQLSAEDTFRQHMFALNSASSLITSQRSVFDRIRLLDDRLATAESFVGLLREDGVLFETRFAHLSEWRDALTLFRSRIKE